MEDNKLPSTQENQEPIVGNDYQIIEVNAEQLKALLQQNKELKDILYASLHLVGFIKQDLFGGEFPSKVNITTITKIITKLPKMVKKLDQDKIDELKAYFAIIQKSSNYMTPEQLKLISNGE